MTERQEDEFKGIMAVKGYFECPRCHALYSHDEYWEEFREKYRFDMDEETFTMEA